MARWTQFDLGIDPLQSIAEQIARFVETFSAILEPAIALIELLQSLLQVPSTPLLALIKAILAAIQRFLANLADTSVNALYMVPENLDDLVQNYQGGFGDFEQSFLNSLYDVNDPERPQVNTQGSVAGLFIFMSMENPASLLKTILTLFQFIERRTNLAFPPPVQLEANPAGPDGYPIGKSLTAAFEDQTQPTRIHLEWQEPRFANDVLVDLFSSNKFYIEKSKHREGKLLFRDETDVRQDLNPAEIKQADKIGGDLPAEPVRHPETGKPVRYWDPLDTNNPPNSFIPNLGGNNAILTDRLGFLSGSYGWAIPEAYIEPGIENGYYYRIRSVPQDVEVKRISQDAHPDVYQLQRNGQPYWGSRPSAPVLGYVPNIDTSFDLPTAILNTYRAAYLMRFDREIRSAQGTILLGSNEVSPNFPQPLIRSTGGFETVTHPGPRGGQVQTQFFTKPLFPDGTLVPYSQAKQDITEDLVTGASVEGLVENMSPFAGTDEYLAPNRNLEPGKRVRLGIDRIVKNKVEKLTSLISKNEALFDMVQSLYTQNQQAIESLLQEGVDTGFGALGGDDGIGDNPREAVHQLIQIFEGNVEQGTPPNWEEVQLIGDVFPVIGELIQELVDFLNSFENILSGVLEEIREALEGIEDRLRALQALIELIEDIIKALLRLLDLLDLNFNLLFIPPQSGGIPQFASTFSQADNPPERDPNEFYTALVFALASPTIQDNPAAKAMQMFFSGG